MSPLDIMAASAKTTIISVAVALALVIIFMMVLPPDVQYIYIDDKHQGDSYMVWGLVIPLVAIVLALVTKRIYVSLFTGIIAGAIIYSKLNLVDAFNALFSNGYGFSATFANIDHVGILLFLIFLGGYIYLMGRAGGTAALARWANGRLKNRTQSQLMTFLLGIILFVDDYFNCLTTSSVMKPVTDRFNVSRAKLAYIIDSIAATICIVVPFSSWAAAAAGSIGGEKAFETLLETIPYNYYAILTLVFVLVLILLKFDFGPMRKREYEAIVNKDVYSDSKQEKIDNDVTDERGSAIDIVVPVLILIFCCVAFMLYTGWINGGTDLISMLGKCDACLGLPLGAVFAFALTSIFYILRKLIDSKQLWNSLPEGFKSMLPAMFILVLAWTLKEMMDLTHADLFVADLMRSGPADIEFMFPIMIFAVGMFLGITTGTSWGTFGILITICISLFTDPTMMCISIAACMSGAVFGDHCSPISDTMIMSSTGSGCDVLVHLVTQFPYAIVVAAISAVCFIMAGSMKSPWIPLLTGVCLVVVILIILKIITLKMHGDPEKD